jgi:formylglycine-generating enzyme required for sulfatase activity
MRTLLLAIALLPAAAVAAEADWVSIPAGSYASALKYEDVTGAVPVAAFELQRRPVTNAEFLAFASRNPAWRRGSAPSLFAEQRYLQHWGGPLALAPAAPDQPVVNVSWFAAQAYCEARGARLPTWSEWEYVAAADGTRRDARADPAWRERILAWYSVPSNRPLPAVGAGEANVYGVRDMHGLVWEWTYDWSAMLVSSDSREQGDPDGKEFCGAGALSMEDKDNYAILMRVAMLSSLEGDDVTGNLGFRCARDAKAGSSDR